MKIYTGFGDKGNTALFGGKSVRKDNPRVEAYGSLDELNSIIGVLRAQNSDRDIDHLLEQIQNQIFVCGSEIATPDPKKTQNFDNQITESEIKFLEQHIDRLSSHLAPLKNFILPAGCQASALAHWARTVCRRAERQLVTLTSDTGIRNDLLVYINRLSDLLFIIARYENKLKQTNDVAWAGLKRK